MIHSVSMYYMVWFSFIFCFEIKTNCFPLKPMEASASIVRNDDRNEFFILINDDKNDFLFSFLVNLSKICNSF